MTDYPHMNKFSPPEQIVAELRVYKDSFHWRAADTIEALRAENSRLKEELEALKKFEREKWTGWAARAAMGESDE